MSNVVNLAAVRSARQRHSLPWWQSAARELSGAPLTRRAHEFVAAMRESTREPTPKQAEWLRGLLRQHASTVAG